ncbi:sigma-70 family RNA polymerase sigma factor [Mariniphaga sediminis]|uniref:Sigma-70 family RNA polymerase sigma factor n=1 Tax=Mariniphaga sediminis TaxID=1628158 RepID=A0A399CUF5_9BACT|nr:sigma-70 family RNA polymerase sigma factor [Mariniphaga sediminis]RIH63484.1 sigma-70 family RNA polymerase sigma factor [Mariniphaga sediminis]
MTKKREFDKDYFLWERFKKGDNKAFFSIYDKFFDTLFNYGLHFSRDKDLIKDCIHDLFLDLYKYREKLSEIDNIRFYLLRSLRRLIHKEKSRKISALRGEQILMQNDIPQMAFEDNLIAIETESENNRVLGEVMKVLSDRQREGLLLKYEQNLSYKEIAYILGISVESARTSVYRALKDLRKALKKKGFSMQVLFIFLRNRNLIL